MAGAVVRDPTTRRCFFVWSFHGLDPMVEAMCSTSQPPIAALNHNQDGSRLKQAVRHTRGFRDNAMKCVQKRSVNGATLASDKPLPRNLEAIEENHTAISEPDLVDRPSEFLRPLLCRRRMVPAEQCQVPIERRATWYFGYTFDGPEIYIEESHI